MFYTIIVLLCLFAVYIVGNWTGYDKGYKDGHEHGLMDSGKGIRKVVDYHNRKVK